MATWPGGSCWSFCCCAAVLGVITLKPEATSMLSLFWVLLVVAQPTVTANRAMTLITLNEVRICFIFIGSFQFCGSLGDDFITRRQFAQELSQASWGSVYKTLVHWSMRSEFRAGLLRMVQTAFSVLPETTQVSEDQVGQNVYLLRGSGRPLIRAARGSLYAPVSRSLGRVVLPLLELLHDLRQVVARRILQGRELLVGLELLQPQHLADGQQVPVVYPGRDRPGERAGHPELRLFLLAHRRLEWIALEVYHAGCELGLDSRDVEAQRGFGRDREIHLPILVAHRRRMGAGIVEEGVARRLCRLARQVVNLVNTVQGRLGDAFIGPFFDLRL